MRTFFILACSILVAGCAIESEDSSAPIDDAEGIVQGAPTSEGQFPEGVLVYGYYQSDGAILCSGVLIDPNWVLTAAKCVPAKNHIGDKADLYFGEIPKSNAYLSRTGKTFYVNPSFKRGTTRRYSTDPINNETLDEHDIALIYFDRAVDARKPAMLPKDMAAQQDLAPANALLDVFGWGMTTLSFGDYPYKLHWGTATVQSRQSCATDLSNYGYKKASTQLSADFLCVKPKSFTSLCYGDFGSGMVAKKPNGDHVVMGIATNRFTANGKMNCSAGRSVFTSVAKHVSWINACMKDSTKC